MPIGCALFSYFLAWLALEDFKKLCANCKKSIKRSCNNTNRRQLRLAGASELAEQAHTRESIVTPDTALKGRRDDVSQDEEEKGEEKINQIEEVLDEVEDEEKGEADFLGNIEEIIEG